MKKTSSLDFLNLPFRTHWTLEREVETLTDFWNVAGIFQSPSRLCFSLYLASTSCHSVQCQSKQES